MITTSSVKIVADTASFVRDMNSADGRMRSFDKTLGGVKSAALSMASAMVAAAGIGGIGMMVQRSMALRDEQAKLADRLGITTQKVAALSLQSSLAGTDSGAFATALEKMVVKLQEAAEKGGPAADSVKALGLNIYDLASKKPDEAFFLISAAMRGMTDENQKLNIITKIFGESATGLVNILNEGRDGFDAAARKTEEFGTALSRVDAAKLEAANDAMTLMKESVDGLATRIGVRLSPMLEQMAENFSHNTIAMAKFFGFRTEQEELNYLMEERARIIDEIAAAETKMSTFAGAEKIKNLNAEKDALRDQINVILDKQKAEAAAFIESDKTRIAEEASTKRRLELAAQEKAAADGKKAALAAELQAMRDDAEARKELFAELDAEAKERGLAEQLLIDQRVMGKINEQQNLREINALMVEDEYNKGVLIAEEQQRQNQEQIARGEAAFSTMLGNVASHNKTFFKIQKLYRLSKLAMEAPAAIADSYAWGASWGGPPAGVTMAGIAAAAMGSYASMLASAQYGGGGSASAGAGSTAVNTNPVTAQPQPGATTLFPEQRQGSINIYIQGLANDQVVNDILIPALRDQIDNHDVILISNNSRNGQQLMPV